MPCLSAPSFRPDRLRTILRLAASVFLSVTTPACGAEKSSYDGAAQIVITDRVVVAAPRRLGVNIGASTYYDDKQVVANPLAQGGFPRGRQVIVVRVADSSENHITVENKSQEPLTVSFAGGSYCIATGVRAGETGKIMAHEPGSGVYELEHAGTPLEAEDLVWIHGPSVSRAFPDRTQGEVGIGMGDFRRALEKGVELDYVDNPDTAGDQFLRLTFPPHDADITGGVKHYIRPTPGTEYRIRIRARSTAPSAQLGVAMRNHGVPHTEPGAQTGLTCEGGGALGGDWREYVFRGRTVSDARIGEHYAEITVALRLKGAGTGGEVLIDYIALEDDHLATESGFSRLLAERLEEARCGVLRFYGIAGLGSLTESITAKNATEASWSYLSLADFYRLGTTYAVVDQWMQLCETVDARPWITVGGANMPEDYYRLISYLAAPADFDADARRRVSHGFDAPWTDKFDTIYLEMGNEWWNGIFRPFYTYLPAKYGQLCATILRRVRQHPHYDPDRIKFIAGGWAINAHHWNRIVDENSEGHDIISLAPYLVHQLDSYGDPSDAYGALFADVDAYRRGPAGQIRRELTETGKGTHLAVYELNTHLTGGAVPDSVASEVCSSLGAGVAVLDQAMSVMECLGTDPVVYFTALQRAYNGRLGLWGMFVRESGGALRGRPVWHGLRLANQHLIEGDMVAVELRGGGAWSQPKNGSVPEMDDVPYLHAYAFVAGDAVQPRRCNVLVVNRHVYEPREVTLTLPFTPAGPARRIELAAEQVGANNEESDTVDLRESSLENVARTLTVVLPPHSATVLKFVEHP